MHAGSGRDRLADHRRHGIRTLVVDLLLDRAGGHDVGLLALDPEVGAVAIRVRHVITPYMNGPKRASFRTAVRLIAP